MPSLRLSRKLLPLSLAVAGAIFSSLALLPVLAPFPTAGNGAATKRALWPPWGDESLPTDHAVTPSFVSPTSPAPHDMMLSFVRALADWLRHDSQWQLSIWLQRNESSRQ